MFFSFFTPSLRLLSLNWVYSSIRPRQYESSEIIRKTPKILKGSATDRKVIADLADALKNNSSFEGQAINYRKDGTPFTMNWRVLPLKIDNQTRAWIAIQGEIGSSNDIVV